MPSPFLAAQIHTIARANGHNNNMAKIESVKKRMTICHRYDATLTWGIIFNIKGKKSLFNFKRSLYCHHNNSVHIAPSTTPCDLSLMRHIHFKQTYFISESILCRRNQSWISCLLSPTSPKYYLLQHD